MTHPFTHNDIIKSAEAVQEAYTKILQRAVHLREPSLRRLSFADFIAELRHQPSRGAVMVFFMIFRFEGDVRKVVGYSLIAFYADSDVHLEEDERSYMAELGNILIGAYLSRMSDLTGENLRASIQPIFESTTGDVAMMLDNLLLLGNKTETLSLAEIHLSPEVDLAELGKIESKHHAHQAMLYVFLR